jgi:CheY-like chemotaxis protein
MSPPPGTRVLIIEDEAIVAMTAEDMIEDMGCVVTGVATTLSEALARAEAGGFDIALLDINLNGDASTPVATLLATRATPFVFTTGYGMAPGREFAGTPLVAKPYRADQLGLAIARALGA